MFKDPYVFQEFSIPHVSLNRQLSKAFSTLQVENMKSVEHEDSELNNDFSIDPLADPRLDKMDLYNMVDSKDRDKIMSATPSFDVGSNDSDSSSIASEGPVSEAPSASGAGE